MPRQGQRIESVRRLREEVQPTDATCLERSLAEDLPAPSEAFKGVVELAIENEERRPTRNP
jgi:hypothetical protein